MKITKTQLRELIRETVREQMDVGEPKEMVRETDELYHLAIDLLRSVVENIETGMERQKRRVYGDQKKPSRILSGGLLGEIKRFLKEDIPS